MTWPASIAYHVVIKRQTFVVGTAGPGLDWTSVLDEIVQRHYSARGVTQARFTRAVRYVRKPTRSRSTPPTITVLIETSREDLLEVRIAPSTDPEMPGAGGR